MVDFFDQIQQKSGIDFRSSARPHIVDPTIAGMPGRKRRILHLGSQLSRLFTISEANDCYEFMDVMASREYPGATLLYEKPKAISTMLPRSRRRLLRPIAAANNEEYTSDWAVMGYLVGILGENKYANQPEKWPKGVFLCADDMLRAGEIPYRFRQEVEGPSDLVSYDFTPMPAPSIGCVAISYRPLTTKPAAITKESILNDHSRMVFNCSFTESDITSVLLKIATEQL
jgi:hypothetical protein